jgi:hypothetical protein
MLRNYPITCSVLALAALLAATAQAALPAPTAAQQQAAAVKKAKDDAQAAQDKAALAAAMDAVAGRWRARAASQGWATRPAVAVAAGASAALPTPATGNAPSGQPEGKLSAQGAALPIRSEKLGTAPPSTDVKQGQTPAQPRGAPPALVKKNTPQVHNR